MLQQSLSALPEQNRQLVLLSILFWSTDRHQSNLLSLSPQPQQFLLRQASEPAIDRQTKVLNMILQKRGILC